LYGVALNRHAEITAYIQSRHPELYEDHALACIKRRWSPAVCLVSPTPHKPQTIEDIELRITGDRCPPDELSAAPAFLLTESGDIDPHSAELAALAVWSGRSECQLPDGSVALSREAARNSHKGKLTIAGRSRRAKGVASSPIMGKWGVFRRHLTNAELLTWRVWFRHPLRSAMRLVPLRIKEGINKAARRRIFDLSFYLQFQPGSLVLANTVIQPLRYFPKRDASRPRIALITPHLGPGGAEAVLQQIATTLRVERFEVLLLATQSRDSRWLNRWRGCVEHVYDLAAAVAPERVPASVFTIVSNWKCDAVLVQNSLPGYAALPQIKSST
jgi:hypothetical protein